MALVDRFGRIHDYLRISVTDRCNLRCVYCMPADGVQFLDESAVMTDDEIVQVVEAGALLGIRKLRLTGGEPTVRRGLTRLVRRLAAVDGIEDIALTTNGMTLRDQAQDLFDAGVSRLNLSLDSMKAEPFQAITRFGDFARVWEGLEKAVEVGFSPIKLNVVLVGGFNEAEVLDFLRLT
ncbi:MAG: radical SAM protein, partial [Firmicutes bacterium]|nr:radical SAM protein [Bacillota bacterium]